MANFNTHISGAAAVAGVAASTAVALHIVTIAEATALWLVGMVGGIMPDIDSDNSHAVDAIFTFLAVLAAFVTANVFVDLPLAYSWLAMALSFVAVRLPLLWLFKSLTIHRGAFHSLLAVVSFGFATACVSYAVFTSSVELAWACGFMMSVGYLTHLLLDELYAVDLSGMALKRSFGSAMKVMAWPSIVPNMIFVAVIIGVIVWMPLPQLSGVLVWDWLALKHLLLGV